MNGGLGHKRGDLSLQFTPPSLSFGLCHAYTIKYDNHRSFEEQGVQFDSDYDHQINRTRTMDSPEDRVDHLRMLSPKIAFLLVSFSLGELGDGLNIFQGIYLVGIGWNEGSVGIALSLMGLTALVIQPFAGDWVDKATFDRRIFLSCAAVLTALSASAILFVQEGNQNHLLIYCTKVVEGISASFIGPCLAALTLATFGPHHFDSIMASNILWGHIGSVVAAVLAGFVAYLSYPNIKYCFLVIGASALLAISFVGSLPQGTRSTQLRKGMAPAIVMFSHKNVRNSTFYYRRCPHGPRIHGKGGYGRAWSFGKT